MEREWLEAAIPIGFSGENKRPQEWRLRLGGYGKVDDSTLFTDRNHVTLFTEESLDLRQMHIYKIPVPKDFLKLHARKRIAIGFAYNPPTRLSRKDYIANSLWFEVYRRTDIETLQKLQNYKMEKRKRTNRDNFVPDDFFDNFTTTHGAGFSPGATELGNSTLQQRVWEKNARGGDDLRWEDNDPFIYILVTGKTKFKHPLENQAQPYALAITFSYDSAEDIQLRLKLSEQVTIKQREQVRVRTQVHM